MKTLVTRRIMMIVAIILVVLTGTAFAQDKIKLPPMEKRVQNFDKPANTGFILNEGLALKVNPTTLGLDFPRFEGICDFEFFDISLVELSGRTIYSTRVKNASGQSISLPLNNCKSKIVNLTIKGNDFVVTRKVFVG